jgi:hypothetical protein
MPDNATPSPAKTAAAVRVRRVGDFLLTQVATRDGTWHTVHETTLVRAYG